MKDTYARRKWHIAVLWSDWRWFHRKCRDYSGRLWWTLWIAGPVRVICYEGVPELSEET